MTAKTEAHPEALRLADRLIGNAQIDECEGCNPVVVALERAAAAELRRQHAEIQQLKAQPSARQAAPDGWRLVPAEPTKEMVTAGQESFGVHDCYYAMLSASPPPPEWEPLSQHDLERLVGNWFAEEWAKKAAFGMLDDYERTRNRSHQ